MKHIQRFETTDDPAVALLTCADCTRGERLAMVHGRIDPSQQPKVVDKGDQRAGHVFIHVATDPMVKLDVELSGYT